MILGYNIMYYKRYDISIKRNIITTHIKICENAKKSTKLPNIVVFYTIFLLFFFKFCTKTVDMSGWDMSGMVVCACMDVRFGLKVCQIGTKWDKSGTFSDQISEKMFWNMIWTGPRFVWIWPFCVQTCPPVPYVCSAVCTLWQCWCSWPPCLRGQRSKSGSCTHNCNLGRGGVDDPGMRSKDQMLTEGAAQLVWMWLLSVTCSAQHMF